MKVHELSDSDREMLAGHNPLWMSRNCPVWMVENYPMLMCHYRPEWMTEYYPGIMSMFTDPWMLAQSDDAPWKLVEYLAHRKRWEGK